MRYASGMTSPQYLRSPELMSADDTALLVVDIQEKLMPAITGGPRILWNIRRLLDAAEILHVPAYATEQYPQGLGPTVPELAGRFPSRLAKTTFSVAPCSQIVGELDQAGRHKVLVVGIEAHVCVQQTVLDLLAGGFRVYVAVDAIGARGELDCQIALRRMDSCGANLTTSESVLFEWCQESSKPEFKKISALVREQPPA